MNKTIVWVVVGVVVIAGLGFYFSQNPYTPDDQYPSATVTPTPTGTATVAPANGSPVVVTNSSVSSSDTAAIVKGNISPNGAFTSYWYEYGTSANLGSRTAIQMIGSGFTNTPSPAIITGLSKNTTYYFRLVAENQNGKSQGQLYTFQTTQGTVAPVGSAPTAKTTSASGISRTTANLNGTVNPNRTESAFWFEYGTNQNLGNTTALIGAGNGNTAAAASISVSNLAPDTTYYFRLNAQNQFGTVNGAILSFKTSGPAAASAPSVATTNTTSINETTATVHGTVNQNGAQTTYWFEYSYDSLLGAALLQSTSKTTLSGTGNTGSVSKNLSGLISNTTYYYRIVGQNSQGTSRGEKMSFKTD